MISPSRNRRYSIFFVLFLCISLFSWVVMAEDELPLEKKSVINIIVSMLLQDNKSVVQPSPTGKLNDTGITQCGSSSGNGVTCPQTGFPGQDAEIGRDADPATNDDADGHRGFSFTKISSTGEALPASAAEWSCVKDNVTGLIWEVKTDDGGLHDKDWTYTWYEPDNSKNGGNAGTQVGGICGGTSSCDTASYVQAVNAGGWCGANDWRMPTVGELSGIARLDRYKYPGAGSTSPPVLDSNYFPEFDAFLAIYVWSASPFAKDAHFAWQVYFNSGNGTTSPKNQLALVRLVRGGQ